MENPRNSYCGGGGGSPRSQRQVPRLGEAGLPVAPHSSASSAAPPPPTAYQKHERGGRLCVFLREFLENNYVFLGTRNFQEIIGILMNSMEFQ